VKSSIDGEEYLCRNRDDKEQAANILATIKERLTSIVQYLKQNHSDEESVQRLVQKFKPKQISESISGTKYTSYSVNKGEKIVFCIRSKDQEEKLIDINTLMFVAIHELAHIMTRSIGHTQEFWSNMKRLLKVGIRQKLYVRQDFKSNPVPYCGTTITDSPLDVEEEA
jgi:predicted metal-dependent hydrolase